MDTKTANKVSGITIGWNVVLAAVKLAAGIFAHSQALISDALHSVSDVISTVAVIFGINLASKKSDDSHPYGHERIECIFSMVLSMILFVTGTGIGISAINSATGEIAIPGRAALFAAAMSIVIKEWMYHYTRKAAIRIKSSAMLADAWHHRSDALSSIGSLIGIAGALLGYPVCDPIASVIICLFIIKASYDIFIDAVNRLVDRSCSNEEIEKMKDEIAAVNGVIGIDDLRTRRFGSKTYVDVEISADKNLDLMTAHKIAEEVHDKIEHDFRDVKHCMVHVNPV